MRDSLRGLATGDAFGAQFFVPDNRETLRARRLPVGPWSWTDDTEMASSVVDVLTRCSGVDQDVLARSFAERHDFDSPEIRRARRERRGCRRR
ncbi:ADP-ribosylglycohydrolase family protein [Streptacidiphilus pinicola]|uniref:ADP-ribosylglycohydrolase family protein n=1 Tax=Streptacidiphilus pinicola TaxID=2219663 RepID=UPI00269F1051